MGKIDRHNYEAFFVDYYDGNLSAADESMLMDFLKDNDDFENEFRDFKNLNLSSPDLAFEDKLYLKKLGIEGEEKIDWMIAALEGQLEESEQAQFHKNLAVNEEDLALYNQVQKTVLIPPSIIYPNKLELKKHASIIPVLRYGLAIAASLLLFFVLNNDSPKSLYNTRSVNLISSTIEVEKDTFQLSFFKRDKKLIGINNQIIINDSEITSIKRENIEQLAFIKPTSIEVAVLDQYLVLPKGEKTDVIQPKIKPIASVITPQTPLQLAIAFSDKKINKAENEKGNPLKLLEHSIESITKQEATIVSTKTKSRKTFFVKIGKFEFSRSKKYKAVTFARR